MTSSAVCTRALQGNNAAVTDVELLNAFNGVSAVAAHRHYIARVQGQPINIGIYIDSTYDVRTVVAHGGYRVSFSSEPWRNRTPATLISKQPQIGRLEDIHFNPWFSINVEYMYWQTTYGRAFVMGRSDWECTFRGLADDHGRNHPLFSCLCGGRRDARSDHNHSFHCSTDVFNTFAFAYAYGYHFVETPTGTMNGNFLGIGADYACNASVQVDAAQAPGLLITNGEFTSFHDKSFAPNSTAGEASRQAATRV